VITPRDGVKVAAPGHSRRVADPTVSRARPSTPYDVPCAVPRGLVTFPGAAAAAAAAVAGLPAAEKFRLLCPVLGIAGALHACWPDLTTGPVP
jgi:hypothetical protein